MTAWIAATRHRFTRRISLARCTWHRRTSSTFIGEFGDAEAHKKFSAKSYAGHQWYQKNSEHTCDVVPRSGEAGVVLQTLPRAGCHYGPSGGVGVWEGRGQRQTIRKFRLMFCVRGSARILTAVQLKHDDERDVAKTRLELQDRSDIRVVILKLGSWPLCESLTLHAS